MQVRAVRMARSETTTRGRSELNRDPARSLPSSTQHEVREHRCAARVRLAVRWPLAEEFLPAAHATRKSSVFTCLATPAGTWGKRVDERQPDLYGQEIKKLDRRGARAVELASFKREQVRDQALACLISGLCRMGAERGWHRYYQL